MHSPTSGKVDQYSVWLPLLQTIGSGPKPTEDNLVYGPMINWIFVQDPINETKHTTQSDTENNERLEALLVRWNLEPTHQDFKKITQISNQAF